MTQHGPLVKLGKGIGHFLGSFRAGYNEALGRRGKNVVSSIAGDTYGGGAYGGDGTTLEYHAIRRAARNSWVFSAISMISNEMSASRLQVVEYKGEDEEPVQISNHPLEQLLRRPNPYLSGEFLWRYTSWWMELYGNAYWFLVFDELGHLVEVWPIPAEDINPMPDEQRQGQWISHYEYRANDNTYQIPPQYIVHFAYPNPFDVFRGLAPLTAAMMGVDTDLAMSGWNSRFFGRDNTMPSAIINITNGEEGPAIDVVDVEALKEDLRTGYAAAQRKTAVTSVAQLQVEQLGWSQRDLDFTEGRQFTKEEIYEIYGIPPGLYDPNATYANSDNSDRVFRDKKLWPALRLLAAQMTVSLVVPLYGAQYAAVFEDPRTGNRELVMSEIQTATPFFTIDEIRKTYYGADPMPDDRGAYRVDEERPNGGGDFGGGDFGAAVDQVAAGGDVETEEEPEAPSGGERPPPEEEEASDEEEPPGEHERALDDLKKWRKKALKNWRKKGAYKTAFYSIALPEQMVISVHERLRKAMSIEEIKTTFEEARGRLVEQAAIKAPLGKLSRPWTIWQNNLYNAIRVFTNNEKRHIKRLVEEKGDGILVDSVFWADYRRRLRAAIAAPAMRLALLGALHGRRRIPKELQDTVDWNLANQSAITWAKQYANGIVSTVVDTLSSDMKDQVAEWAEAGETTPDLVSRILTKVDSRDKAEQIAETEATRIYAEGSDQAYQASGIPPMAIKAPAHVRCRCYHQPKRLKNGDWVVVWYTVRDERVCVQDLDVPWQVEPVKGCRGLHGLVISQGQYLGQKYTDIQRRA